MHVWQRLTKDRETITQEMREERDDRQRKADLEDHIVQRWVETDREERQKAQMVRWLDFHMGECVMLTGILFNSICCSELIQVNMKIFLRRSSFWIPILIDQGGLFKVLRVSKICLKHPN